MNGNCFGIIFNLLSILMKTILFLSFCPFTDDMNVNGSIENVLKRWQMREITAVIPNGPNQMSIMF